MLANLHTWRRTLGIDPIKELLNRPGQKVSVEVPVERAVPVKRGLHDGALSASDAFVVSVHHLDYRVVVTIVGLRSVCVCLLRKLSYSWYFSLFVLTLVTYRTCHNRNFIS
jgi:hypothetical protein